MSEDQIYSNSWQEKKYFFWAFHLETVTKTQLKFHFSDLSGLNIIRNTKYLNVSCLLPDNFWKSLWSKTLPAVVVTQISCQYSEKFSDASPNVMLCCRNLMLYADAINDRSPAKVDSKLWSGLLIVTMKRCHFHPMRVTYQNTASVHRPQRILRRTLFFSLLNGTIIFLRLWR